MRMIHMLAVLCMVAASCFAAEEQMLLELQEVTVDRTAAQRSHAVFKSNEETPRIFRIPLQFSSDKVGKNERNIIMLIRYLPAGTKLGFMVLKGTPENVAEWELAYLTIKKAEQPPAGDVLKAAPEE